MDGRVGCASTIQWGVCSMPFAPKGCFLVVVVFVVLAVCDNLLPPSQWTVEFEVTSTLLNTHLGVHGLVDSFIIPADGPTHPDKQLPLPCRFVRVLVKIILIKSDVGWFFFSSHLFRFFPHFICLHVFSPFPTWWANIKLPFTHCFLFVWDVVVRHSLFLPVVLSRVVVLELASAKSGLSTCTQARDHARAAHPFTLLFDFEDLTFKRSWSIIGKERLLHECLGNFFPFLNVFAFHRSFPHWYQSVWTRKYFSLFPIFLSLSLSLSQPSSCLFSVNFCLPMKLSSTIAMKSYTPGVRTAVRPPFRWVSELFWKLYASMVLCFWLVFIIISCN